MLVLHHNNNTININKALIVGLICRGLMAVIVEIVQLDVSMVSVCGIFRNDLSGSQIISNIMASLVNINKTLIVELCFCWMFR